MNKCDDDDTYSRRLLAKSRTGYEVVKKKENKSKEERLKEIAGNSE